jgi:hypothetical protein
MLLVLASSESAGATAAASCFFDMGAIAACADSIVVDLD